MKEKNKYFKYVVIIGVLIIPFLYSFFYLKAYWNPYGEGNIDNLDIAIVNNDKGDKGSSLIKSIKDSKKLKIHEEGEKVATDGLYDRKYYAVITIPEDFTSSMESAKDIDKHHAIITYSPNQKSNYLASQIINNVVLNVEKKLDNEVNSEIVGALSETIHDVPGQLNTISDGFTELKEGTGELNSGTSKISTGTNDLKSNYNKFDNGIKDLSDGVSTLNKGTNDLETNYTKFNNGLKTVKDGSETLTAGMRELNSGIETLNNSVGEFDTLTNGIGQLQTGVSTLKAGSDQFTSLYTLYKELNSLIINKIQTGCQTNDATCIATINLLTTTTVGNLVNSPVIDNQTKAKINAVISANPSYANLTLFALEESLGTTLANANASINGGITVLNNNMSNLSDVPNKINTLKFGIKNLKDGSNKLLSGATDLSNGTSTLYNRSLQIVGGINKLTNGTNSLLLGTTTLSNGSDKLKNGINTLNNGTLTLSSGMSTLDNSVGEAKTKLDNKINDTKKDVKKVESLKEYAKEPVKIKQKTVNEVASYGTAFSPFFISIALWVGCLMMYIVLYYDKEERFDIMGMKNKNRLQRNAAYHGLITISAIMLGILLQALLDFQITNVFLYYISIILVANMFMAIIQFLIMNFNDIGKFFALIILVLQLAAAGGTFPIETVTKGFRWMHPLLPMKYTNELLRESLVSIESSLLTKNILIVSIILVVFVGINVTIDIIKKSKEEQN